MAKITDPACKAAKPGAELHDGNNLVLRVGLKRKTWTLVWREGKAVRKVGLGSYPDMGVGAARLAAQAGIARLRQGLHPVQAAVAPSPSPPPAPPATTVHTLLKTYLDRHVALTAKDPDQVEWVIDTVLKPLHDRDAAKLTRGAITAFLDDVTDTRGGPSGYRAGSVLRAAFRFNLRRGAIETDPTHLLSLPAQGKPRERVLSDAEVGKLWRTRVPVWSRLFRVLLATGLRLREAAEAPAAEIEGHTWSIPAERMKGGRAHVVPLCTGVLAELGELGGARWLFRSPRRFDQPIKGFSRGLEALQQAAGTTADWTWHDTRRTIASGLQRLGAPAEVIEAILAHRRPGISAVYQRHDFLAERRHWLGIWLDHCSRKREN